MKRILVVDDERQITRMLRTALQSSGYEVTVAQNGREALERIRQQTPDLIIADLAMPELNGVELTQALRRSAETPIIVLSVRNTEGMKVRALDQDADDYIAKPFKMPELLARVRAERTYGSLMAYRVDLGFGVMVGSLLLPGTAPSSVLLTPSTRPCASTGPLARLG